MNQLTMEEIKLLNEKQKYQNRHFKGHYKGKFWAYRRLSFYCGSTDITFFHEMNINPANPKMENRDRLVISKGHGAPALYAALAEKGYFPKEEMDFCGRLIICCRDTPI